MFSKRKSERPHSTTAKPTPKATKTIYFERMEYYLLRLELYKNTNDGNKLNMVEENIE